MKKDFFYKKSGPFSLEKIVEKINVKVIGNNQLVINDIAPLAVAEQSDITFFFNTKYVNDLKNTRAGACILKEEHIKYAPKGATLVVTSNPQLVYALFIAILYPEQTKKPIISKSADIDVSAKIGDNCTILDGAVIGKNAVIGDFAYIGCNTVIGDNVVIGSNTKIESNATVVYAIIGKNCSIYSGVRIGQDGFGFIPGGPKIKQVGIVEIGNNVEIGANVCIDRGTLGNTVIKDNCKIDNLVQIGHNVEIDENTIIVAQVGISGSTKIGKNVMLGGQVGIAGHLKIGDKVMVAAQSGVINDIAEGEVVGGYPAIKINDWHRQSIFLKKQINRS